MPVRPRHAFKAHAFKAHAFKAHVFKTHGTTLAIGLALFLVLGGFGIALGLLSSGPYRELDPVSGHLRALSVGQIALADVTARLAATPWPERWFRAAPEVVENIPAGGGAYSYLLRDAPAPVALADPVFRGGLASPHQAELVIESTFERAAVVQYVRLAVPVASLDSLTRVVSVYFTFAPEGSTLSGRDVAALSAGADASLRAREANRGRFEDRRRSLARARTALEIGQAWGAPAAARGAPGTAP